MIGHKRVPSREGGVEVVVENLSVRMASRGNDVTLYNRRGKHIAGEKYNQDIHEYKGIRIKNVFTIDRKGVAALTSSVNATLIALLSRHDIIHYHAEGPCVMLWLTHILGVKTVATIHGLDWKRGKWGRFAQWYLKLGEKFAAKYAGQIIVLSRNMQDYFEKTYGRKTVYIPNGVVNPQKCDADEIDTRWGLKKDEYILFLARVVPEKGLHYLIEAYQNLETDKKLVVAGSSSDSAEYYEEMERFASQDPRIMFVGFVQGNLLKELLSNAYLYVLPSDLEGMPLSLLEAMSYGNCCVISDIPENVEVADGEAVTFRRGDSKSLLQVLKKLTTSPDLVRAYKLRSAQTVLQKYSWDEIVDQTMSVYQKELDGNV